MTEPTNENNDIQKRPASPSRKPIDPSRLNVPERKNIADPSRPAIHPLLYIPIVLVAVIASTVASVFVREAMRGRGSGPLVVIGGGLVLLMGGFYAIRWLVRSVRADRPPVSLRVVECLFGLLIALGFFFGGVGRDQWLRGPDAWLGVLPQGYLGWTTALLNGLGVGVGVALVVHGLTRRTALLGNLVVSFLVALICALVGPALSEMHYRNWEQVAWGQLTQNQPRNFGLYKPRYDWDWHYFQRIPKAYQRPEAWAKALMAQATSNESSHPADDLAWCVVQANRHADLPGMEEARSLALRNLTQFVQSLKDPKTICTFLYTVYVFRHNEDNDVMRLALPMIDQVVTWCGEGKHQSSLRELVSMLSNLPQRPDPNFQRIVDAFSRRPQIPNRN